MANTYAALFYHLLFSTKNRVNYLRPDIEARVWSYIGGVARKHGLTALQVGGVENHIHALVMAPPTHSPSEIVKSLKGDSSKWIHKEFADLVGFAWQGGYGAFTVSRSNVAEVISYIQNQREHHRKKSFQEEYLEFLRRHGVEYDERYVGVIQASLTRRTTMRSLIPGVETPG